MSDIQINEAELLLNLVNGTWDDIEDLKTFSVWPTGEYKIRTTKAEIKTDAQTKDGAPTVKIMVVGELIEVIQVAEGQEARTPEEGALTSFNGQGKFGIEKFKSLFAEIGAECGAKGPIEMCELLSNGMELAISVKEKTRNDGRVDPDTGKPLTNNDWMMAILA